MCVCVHMCIDVVCDETRKGKAVHTSSLPALKVNKPMKIWTKRLDGIKEAG